MCLWFTGPAHLFISPCSLSVKGNQEAGSFRNVVFPDTPRNAWYIIFILKTWKYSVETMLVYNVLLPTLSAEHLLSLSLKRQTNRQAKKHPQFREYLSHWAFTDFQSFWEGWRFPFFMLPKYLGHISVVRLSTVGNHLCMSASFKLALLRSRDFSLV